MLRRTFLALGAITFLLLPLGALAEDGVRVTVHVIHASKKPGKVDERVKELAKQHTNCQKRGYCTYNY